MITDKGVSPARSEDREPASSAADKLSYLFGPQLVLRRGVDAIPVPVEWLWPGWLAEGKLHLLGGAPGTGKTTIAVTMAATVTAGGLWPDGARAEPGNVVIWSGEDDIDDTLSARLMAAGADMERVRFVESVADRGERFPFDPARDLELLRDKLRCIPNVRLIVIDPVVSAVTGDSHKNAEVRRSLQPLVDLAKEFGCAVLGITHFSKGTRGRDPVERVIGSVAFTALPRIVMVTAKGRKEGDDAERRVLVRAKSNIGPDGGGFAYTFAHEALAGVPNVYASRVMWGESIAGDAGALLAEAEDDAHTLTPEEFLRSELAAGAQPVKDIFIAGAALGFSEDVLRRSASKLAIRPKKRGFRPAAWWWTLDAQGSPGDDADADENANDGHEGDEAGGSTSTPEEC